VKRVRSGLPAEALSQLGVGPSGVSTTGSFAAVSLLIRVHKFSIEWVVNVVETALRDAAVVAHLLLTKPFSDRGRFLECLGGLTCTCPCGGTFEIDTSEGLR
jgi:hypothetical protein